MQFRLPSEQNVPVESLSEDTLSTRKKAHSTFITLCKAHAKLLLPNLKSLVDKSEELWIKVHFPFKLFSNQSMQKELVSSELIYMYEAFTVISLEIPNRDIQAQFIAYLLQSPKNDWQNPKVTQLLSDPMLLLKMVEIIPEPNQQQLQALREVIIFLFKKDQYFFRCEPKFFILCSYSCPLQNESLHQVQIINTSLPWLLIYWKCYRM